MGTNNRIYSGGAGNLLKMASLQHGAFSIMQAKLRGVSQETLKAMEEDGLIEDMGMGFYSLTEKAKWY